MPGSGPAPEGPAGDRETVRPPAPEAPVPAPVDFFVRFLRAPRHRFVRIRPHPGPPGFIQSLGRAGGGSDFALPQPPAQFFFETLAPGGRPGNLARARYHSLYTGPASLWPLGGGFPVALPTPHHSPSHFRFRETASPDGSPIPACATINSLFDSRY